MTKAERDSIELQSHARLCAPFRAWRVNSGLTQGQLAKKLGIARCTISRVELGDVRVSLLTLNLIAAEYNLELKPDALIDAPLCFMPLNAK